MWIVWSISRLIVAEMLRGAQPHVNASIIGLITLLFGEPALDRRSVRSHAPDVRLRRCAVLKAVHIFQAENSNHLIDLKLILSPPGRSLSMHVIGV
jgi:hypothetical protein